MYKSGLSAHKKKCKKAVDVIEKLEQVNKQNENLLQEKEVLRNLVEESFDKFTKMNHNKVKELFDNFVEKNSNEVAKPVHAIRHQRRKKLSKKTREEVATRQENKCNQCQVTLTKYYQIDHKTALQYGGTDEFDNLQALCCECHAEKSVLENQHRKEIQEAIHSILQGHVLEK